jgi:hypothetical protein
LVGLILRIQFDVAFFELVSATCFPSLACRIAGITDKKQLAKIAVYAGIGWMITYFLGPAVTQSAASHAQRIAASPLIGNEWHIATSLASALLALVGVYFIPTTTTTNRITAGDNGLHKRTDIAK